jgi:hypothetical protein
MGYYSEKFSIKSKLKGSSGIPELDHVFRGEFEIKKVKQA